MADRLGEVSHRLTDATRLALAERGWPTRSRSGAIDMSRPGLSLRLEARSADPDTEVGYGIALLVSLTIPDARGGIIEFETFQFGTSLDDAAGATGVNLAEGFLLPLRALLGGPDHPASTRTQLFTHDVDADRSAWWDCVVGPLHVIRAGAATRIQLDAASPFEHLRDWYIGELGGAEFHWMVVFVTHGEASLGGGILLDGRLFTPPPAFDRYP